MVTLQGKRAVGSLLTIVTGNLISSPSSMSIRTSTPGRRKAIICRVRITRGSVNEVVNGRNEVTGTVHAVTHDTTVHDRRGVVIRVS